MYACACARCVGRDGLAEFRNMYARARDASELPDLPPLWSKREPQQMPRARAYGVNIHIEKLRECACASEYRRDVHAASACKTRPICANPCSLCAVVYNSAQID